MPLTPKTLTQLPSLTPNVGNYTFSLDSDHHTATLILSCSQCVLTYNFNNKSYRHFADSSGLNVQSVAYHEKSGKVYFYVNGSVKELPFNTLQGVKKFCTAPSYTTPSRIAVNDKYLVCSNTQGYYLMSYNLSTSAIKHYISPLANWIKNLKFHPDGDIVVLDRSSKISKCKIQEHGSLELVWECTAVPGPYALCVDKQRGLVYVTGSGQMLYIIDNGKID